MTGEEILNVKMIQPNDAGVDTIRDYLKKLVRMVFDEDEGFDGKRPFGNSGWWSELYDSLEAAGLDAETEDYCGAIHKAIAAL
jgi:hypothetical protein